MTLEEAVELGVTILPMTVSIGGKNYRDRYDITPNDFYDMLEQSKEFPKTSMINPFGWGTEFKHVNDAGDEAVVITLSSALSGTYQSAVIAADDYEGIHVVDSLGGSITQQCLVRYAVKLRDNGRSAENIAKMLRECIGDIRLQAMIDTLEYLKKGGRISGAVYAAGSLLNLKPVLTFKNGELVMSSKARGRKNGLAIMKKFIAEHGIDFSKPCIAAYSGHSRESVDSFIESLREIFGDEVDKIIVTQAGSTIGSYAGQGLVTLGFFINPNAGD